MNKSILKWLVSGVACVSLITIAEASRENPGKGINQGQCNQEECLGQSPGMTRQRQGKNQGRGQGQGHGQGQGQGQFKSGDGQGQGWHRDGSCERK